MDISSAKKENSREFFKNPTVTKDISSAKTMIGSPRADNINFDVERAFVKSKIQEGLAFLKKSYNAIKDKKETVFEEGIFSGRLKSGLPYGIGYFEFDDDRQYVGNFKNGRMYGFGILKTPTRGFVMGCFIDNKISSGQLFEISANHTLRCVTKENLTSEDAVVSYTQSRVIFKGRVSRGYPNKGIFLFENGESFTVGDDEISEKRRKMNPQNDQDYPAAINFFSDDEDENILLDDELTHVLRL